MYIIIYIAYCKSLTQSLMRHLTRHLSLIFNITAGSASIIGIIIFAFSDATNAIIALVFFCLSLLALLISIIWAINSFVKRGNENNHLKVSVFTKFEALNTTNSIFETYRVIQSKRLVLSEIEQNFKWSGSKLPNISSKFQEVKNIIINERDYDKAILTFKKPLLYNETGVVHFRAETDDYDGTAKPYLDYKVESHINIIHYRVILKYKNDFHQPAKVLKRPINCNSPTEYTEISSITFDERAKCYEYYLINPEPGYFYRIQWEK